MEPQPPRERKPIDFIEFEKQLKIAIPNKVGAKEKINIVSEKIDRKMIRIKAKLKSAELSKEIPHEPSISLSSITKGKDETTFIYKIAIIINRQQLEE